MRAKNHRRHNQKQSIRRKQRHLLISITCFVFTFCMISGVFVFTANAKEDHEVYKYYTSIEIQEGDTLWDIEATYNSDDVTDCASYIQEVKEINHIQGDEIHAGEYLTIPYFSAENK